MTDVAGIGSKAGSSGRGSKRPTAARSAAGTAKRAATGGTARKAAMPRAVKIASKPGKRTSAAGRAAKRITDAVAKALPGWKIVDSPAALAGKMEDGFVRIDKGPSIADLKRKFLHDDDAQDGANPFEADDGRVSVRIRPERGGEAKTADVGPDGKVTIVQG